MTSWAPEQLGAIGAADELDIAALRPDGTLRPSTTIWVVRVGDGLYVRSYWGEDEAWYQAVRRRPEGRIRAGGAEYDGRQAGVAGQPFAAELQHFGQLGSVSGDWPPAHSPISCTAADDSPPYKGVCAGRSSLSRPLIGTTRRPQRVDQPDRRRAE